MLLSRAHCCSLSLGSSISITPAIPMAGDDTYSLVAAEAAAALH
jgi:hypothetical protein